MPSRSKIDLLPILAAAYDQAAAIWVQKYPTLPQPFITCTFRSKEEQNILYAQGRTVKGSKVTNAKGGQSPHNFCPSFAFDIAFVGLNKKLDWKPDLFKKFADLILAIDKNVEWGGNFKSLPDAPHFQLLNYKQKLP